MAAANRRTVLIAAAGAAAVAVLPAFAAASEGVVAVFEADEPVARAFARGRAQRIAVDGDRVRFARKLFADARPARVAAVTRYADYLVLAEAAREHGYRAALTGPLENALFAWTAVRAA